MLSQDYLDPDNCKRKYFLEGHSVHPWDKDYPWRSDNVKKTLAQTWVGHYFIVSVFTGIAQSFTMELLPVVFETTVMGGGLDLTERTTSWSRAMAAHQHMVDRMKRYIHPWSRLKRLLHLN